MRSLPLAPVHEFGGYWRVAFMSIEQPDISAHGSQPIEMVVPLSANEKTIMPVEPSEVVHLEVYGKRDP